MILNKRAERDGPGQEEEDVDVASIEESDGERRAGTTGGKVAIDGDEAEHQPRLHPHPVEEGSGQPPEAPGDQDRLCRAGDPDEADVDELDGVADEEVEGRAVDRLLRVPQQIRARDTHSSTVQGTRQGMPTNPHLPHPICGNLKA